MCIRDRFNTVRHNDVNGIAVAAHDSGFGRDVIGEDPVAAFLQELRLGVGDDMIGLGGKTDDKARTAGLAMGDGGQNIGIFHQLDGRRPAVLLDLVLTHLLRTPVGDGGGEHGDIGRQRLLDRRQHLPRGFNMNHRNAGRIRQVHGAADQHDLKMCIRDRC